MKPPRSCQTTLDIPVTLVRGQYTWSCVCAVRMSPRTGGPTICDIVDLQRFSWGCSYQFDVADADAKAVVALMDAAREAYLASTIEAERRAP